MRKIHDVQALPQLVLICLQRIKIYEKRLLLRLDILINLTHFTPANTLADDPDQEVKGNNAFGNFREDCIVPILCT